jgi:hypothetical protein
MPLKSFTTEEELYLLAAREQGFRSERCPQLTDAVQIIPLAFGAAHRSGLMPG